MLVRYDGNGSVREYIYKMCKLVNDLRFFQLFKVNYNSQKVKCGINQLLAFCVIEWKRLKGVKTESAYLVVIFIIDLLIVFGFPQQFVDRITQCTTTASYSISLNGELFGFFKGKRGVRQGDPISPLLFVLAMEVLSQLFTYHIRLNPGFKYHWRCSRLAITHLTFADDIMIFSHANIASIQILLNALNQFLSCSGLEINRIKSLAFFAGVDTLTKNAILQLLQIEADCLPITYLGVPLSPSSIVSRDCQSLVDRITARIRNWTFRFLSYAGKASGVELKKSGAKAAWSAICRPKINGGLGFPDLELSNILGNLRHIWKLCTKKDSLWVAWTFNYLIKAKSIWTIKPTALSSGFWRRLLKLRGLACGLIRHRVGAGTDTMMWLDFWLPNGPVVSQLGLFEMEILQLDTYVSVDSLISNFQWVIPPAIQFP
ncbi:uncharacterized protein LOC132281108 [Cornus florida]|uniref:uncharacterized protein LOC132281108 n=1 Tax=Cornus florida TaxID=4283 RepID=UPI00289E2344|nr:uncharacterized protein LOC132281108 [Cornus florida]